MHELISPRGKSSAVVGAKTTIEAAAVNVDQTWITENMQPLFMTPKGEKKNAPQQVFQCVCLPAPYLPHTADFLNIF